MAFDEKNGADDDEPAFEAVYDSTRDSKCSIFSEGVKHGNITVNNNKIQMTGGSWTGYVYWTFSGDAIGGGDNNEQVAIWEFMIDQYQSGGYYLDFGIATDPQGIINAGNVHYSSGNMRGKYYFIYGYQGSKYSHEQPSSLVGCWGQGCKTGDKIKMKLDCGKKTLSFWKNNAYMGVAYNNIKFNRGGSSKGYHLAIGLSYQSNAVSILKYQKSVGIPSMKSDLMAITKFYENAVKNGTKLMYLLAKNQQNSKNNTDNKSQKQDNKEELSFDMIVKISQEIGNYSELIPAIEKKHEELCKILKQITQCHSDICKPDIKKYNEWSLNEIIFWIMSLENGRYQKYIEKLKKSFKENQISGKDLPHLTRQDLHVSFGISVFRDRMDLEKHFQKLSNDEGM